ARIKLYEVMNDRKIHEKLKENAFEDFMKELNAQESKEIDELVSYTYGKAR
ncbi:flagellar export protein FliJ, partial [Lachnotalea glycerini]